MHRCLSNIRTGDTSLPLSPPSSPTALACGNLASYPAIVSLDQTRKQQATTWVFSAVSPAALCLAVFLAGGRRCSLSLCPETKPAAPHTLRSVLPACLCCHPFALRFARYTTRGRTCREGDCPSTRPRPARLSLSLSVFRHWSALPGARPAPGVAPRVVRHIRCHRCGIG